MRPARAARTAAGPAETERVAPPPGGTHTDALAIEAPIAPDLVALQEWLDSSWGIEALGGGRG